jgi:hypothetical protein
MSPAARIPAIHPPMMKENGIEIDKERAGEYIRAFFRSYPRVNKYLEPCRYLCSRALIYQEQGGQDHQVPACSR